VPRDRFQRTLRVVSEAELPDTADRRVGRSHRDREVPTLLIESDLEDPRYFSQAQLRNRIDAFFEALAQRRITAASDAALIAGGVR